MKLAKPIAIGLVLLALAGGTSLAKAKPRPPRLMVNVPCVIASPMQRVAGLYERSHPGTAVRVLTEKPLAMLSSLRSAKDELSVVVTMGEVEMAALVSSGTVDRNDVTVLDRNAYHLAVIVPTESPAKSLADLAGPKVKRIALEDPKISTLGNRAQQAFTKLGLWKAVERKVVRFDPTENVLSQLLEGKADAAVVYKNCLFTESGAAPRTVRVLGAFPVDSYRASTYRAAPLKTSRRAPQAKAFVQFLASKDGRKSLRDVGLTTGP